MSLSVKAQTEWVWTELGLMKWIETRVAELYRRPIIMIFFPSLNFISPSIGKIAFTNILYVQSDRFSLKKLRKFSFRVNSFNINMTWLIKCEQIHPKYEDPDY